MPTWSSNLSGAHLNRTKVVIACISAAHTTMSKLGAIYYIRDDPSKKLTRLLLHVVSKYRHFQQRTSNAKRCPLRRLLLRRVLILAAAVMVRRKGAATSVHGRWKMTTTAQLHRWLVQARFCTSHLHNSDTIHDIFSCVITQTRYYCYDTCVILRRMSIS